MPLSLEAKPLEEITITRIRGSALPLIAAAARASSGEDAWQEHLQELSPAARTLLEATPAMDVWLDAGLVAECLWLFHGSTPLGSIPGVLGAENFRARSPLAFHTPEELLAALPGFWSSSAEGGVMETALTGPNTATIRIYGLWAVPYFFDVHAPAWFSHGLKLCGRTGVTVGYVPPANPWSYLHDYHLEWN